MDRPKIVALITGILSIALAVFYLALVLILDHRSGLEPAPVGVVGSGLGSELGSEHSMVSLQ